MVVSVYYIHIDNVARSYDTCYYRYSNTTAAAVVAVYIHSYKTSENIH